MNQLPMNWDFLNVILESTIYIDGPFVGQEFDARLWLEQNQNGLQLVDGGFYALETRENMTQGRIIFRTLPEQNQAFNFAVLPLLGLVETNELIRLLNNNILELPANRLTVVRACNFGGQRGQTVFHASNNDQFAGFAKYLNVEQLE